MQDVAKDENPVPVKVKTEFMVPDVGVTTILAVTLNGADVMSFRGVPRTCTTHAMSWVAYGPTTKDPTAIVDGPMEQVGEVINFVLDAPVPSTACTTHPVSDGDNPVARKETVTPLVELDGIRFNPGAP